MEEFLTDVDSWGRKGRGKSFQFFAADAEIAAVLCEALPPEFAPYSLIAIEKERVQGRFIQRPIQLEVDGFLGQRAKGTWRFFLRSHTITPDLEMPSDVRADMLLAMNGLVNVFHGVVHRDRVGASVIGVVDRIVHRTTRRSIYHEHYVEVFKSLRDGIVPLLFFKSVFSGGAKSREDPSILISEKAAALHRDGKVLLEAEPGCVPGSKKLGS